MKEDERKRTEFYKEQALIYFEKNIPVHILKNDGIFYNGLIVEVGTNFFFINDLKEGRLLIFFHELKNDIIEFKERKNG